MAAEPGAAARNTHSTRGEPGGDHGGSWTVERAGVATTGSTALLAAAAGFAGLLAPGWVFRSGPAALADAAGAQDVVTLVVVAPLLLVLLRAASRGHLASWVCCLGVLAFTAYNAAIYALSVDFGPLFLVWVATLGLSSYALLIGLIGLRENEVRNRLGEAGGRVTGGFLVAVAVLFALLWLVQIVSDLVAGGPSTSAATWDVPTNPVHVLDLALFLPAVTVSGVLVLRRHWFGAATAAGQLVFLGLTCLPILLTPAVASSRGHDAGWPVVAPISVVVVLVAAALVNVLRRSHRPRTPRTAVTGRGRNA